ncbi:membrane-associated protein, putative, partial [Bodo saltans]
MRTFSVVARSAIVSNMIFVGVAASTLLLLAVLWSALAHAPFLHATAVLCIPASLLPALAAVVSSTAASATLLLARLGTSECAASDVVLGWSDSRWVAIERTKVATSFTHPLVATVRRLTERRWEWKSTGGDPSGMKHAWPVLLEYRELRYGALDSGVLLLVSIVSVISGLSGASGQCRVWSLVTLLLLAAQVAVAVWLQPFTTPFSQVCGVMTVSLSCLGVLAQLLFVWSNSLWLVDAAAACSLVTLGISFALLLTNVMQIAAALRRRIMSEADLCTQKSRSLEVVTSVELVTEFEHLNKDFDTNEHVVIQLDNSAVELDEVVLAGSLGRQEFEDGV